MQSKFRSLLHMVVAYDKLKKSNLVALKRKLSIMTPTRRLLGYDFFLKISISF